MLPEQMIEYGAIFLMYALHLVNVLRHLFHALECLCRERKLARYSCLLLLFVVNRCATYRTDECARLLAYLSDCASAATAEDT